MEIDMTILDGSKLLDLDALPANCFFVWDSIFIWCNSFFLLTVTLMCYLWKEWMGSNMSFLLLFTYSQYVHLSGIMVVPAIFHKPFVDNIFFINMYVMQYLFVLSLWTCLQKLPKIHKTSFPLLSFVHLC